MKIAILTSTALALTALAAPAYANTTVLSPQARMEAQCLTTKPSDTNNVRYTVVVTGGSPINSGLRELTRVTDPTRTVAGGTLISQTPFVATGVTGRNGGSPNIHGIFESIGTYSGGTLTQVVTEGSIDTYNYGCSITRTNRNNVSDQPPGLQTSGLSFTVTNVTRTFDDVVTADPTFAPIEQERVVCNSPGRKGGVWTGQNGYTNTQCVTLANMMNFITLRTNSVPNLFVSGKPDHDSTVNTFNDHVSQLVDTTVDHDDAPSEG
jgi:hypothetical protein